MYYCEEAEYIKGESVEEVVEQLGANINELMEEVLSENYTMKDTIGFFRTCLDDAYFAERFLEELYEDACQKAIERYGIEWAEE